MVGNLSQDLRYRVVSAIRGGLSCQAAAAHYGVSGSSAVRWRRRALEEGRAVARPRGGDRRSGRIEAQRAELLKLVQTQGDLTLAEMQARLAVRGTPVVIGTIWRFFQPCRLPRDCPLFCALTSIVRPLGSGLRTRWRAEI